MKKEIVSKQGKKYLIVFASVLLLVLGFYFFQVNLSGKVILKLDADYHEGENLDGILKLSLANGEFIPASSKVIFETSGERQEFALRDILSNEPIEGTYYIQEKNISGNGMGYGSAGVKKIYPEVSFEFSVYSDSKKIEENKSGEKEITPGGNGGASEEEVVEVVNETEEKVVEVVNETEEEIIDETSEQVVEETEAVEEIGEIEAVEDIVAEEVAEVISDVSEVEIVSEEIIEEETEKQIKSEEKEVKEEKVSEEVKEEAAPITGNVISSIFRSFASLLQLTPTGQVTLNLETIVSGKTSVDSPFIYNLEKGQTAELVSGSVMSGSTELDDGEIQFEISGDSVIVSTDYFETEEGFGSDYLEDELQVFEINISTINLNFSKGDLNISFVYEGNEIISLSTFLQEGKIEEGNESVLLEVPKVSLENLTEEERQVIIKEFGDVLIKTTKSEVIDGRLIRNYKIGDYELIASYDYESNITDSLNEQMRKDKLNFLRDLIKMISENEDASEGVVEFLGTSSF